MNIINQIFADLPYEEINTNGKCKILSGEVRFIKIKFIKGKCDEANIYIKSYNNYYVLKHDTSKDGLCSDIGGYILYENLPKKGQKNDMLVDKNNYLYIVPEKNKNGDLIFFGKELGYNPEICIPNSNFIEFYKDYLFFGSGIIFLIILVVLLYKKFK